MSKWRIHHLGFVPQRGPHFWRRRENVVAIELPKPRVTIVERTHIHSDDRETRTIGLSLEGNGVVIEVESFDAQTLATELAEALDWLDNPSAKDER